MSPHRIRKTAPEHAQRWISFATLLLIALPMSCAKEPRWKARRLPTADLVAVVLGEGPATRHERYLLAAEVPVVPIRERLRPCCAFGAGLQTNLGSVPILGVKLRNVISVGELGPHRYDSGVLTVETSSGELFSLENNGLIYTCRGGFIDTAHVRDYADWMVYVAAWVARNLESGASQELPAEAGQRRLVLRPTDPKLLEKYGRRRLATPLAQWLTFQLSVWHEIATWYGWSSLKLFPESASAFSPEDLYSNLLGVNLGAAVAYTSAAPTDLTYEQNMDRFLKAALGLLDAVPAEIGIDAITSVDGLWWDSSKRLPQKALVRRRYMDAEPPIDPWLVPENPGSATQQRCSTSQPPIRLDVPTTLGDLDLSELAYLEIEVAEGLPVAFPLPRPPSRRITQADFPAIIATARAQALAEFGPAADRPDR